MEKNSEKIVRGNEIKSQQNYCWVWYKKFLNKDNKLVYINSKENLWNLQNDIVKKINVLVKEGKMGKYNIEYEYIIKCEIGSKLDKVIEIGGDEYKVNDWEVVKGGNIELVFKWDSKEESVEKIKIELVLDK
jgi:hypothetical protein